MRQRKITYNINGQTWNFILTSTAAYRKRHGSDSAAICLIKEREVWFHKNEFSPDVVAHELMHVLFAQSPHGSAQLDAFQTEEIAAEIIHNNWSILPIIVLDVYRKLIE